MMAMLAEGLAALRNIDTLGISSLVWLPVNIWLVWRLGRHAFGLLEDPSRSAFPWDLMASCLVFVVLLVGTYINVVLGRGAFPDLTPGALTRDVWIMVLQTLTASFLLVRVVRAVAEFVPVVRALRVSTSVMSTVLRQQNLKRILAARDAVGMVFLFVTLSVLHAYLTTSDNEFDLSAWVAGVCMVPLVLSFAWAIIAVHGTFRLEARRLLMGSITGMNQLEQGLSEIATRSMAAQIMVREVFMSEILRISVAVVLAIGARL